MRIHRIREGTVYTRCGLRWTTGYPHEIQVLATREKPSRWNSLCDGDCKRCLKARPLTPGQD